MKEIITDLGQVISSSESSSLDETVLYMYSNQLEWMEKCSVIPENPSDETEASELVFLFSIKYSIKYFPIKYSIKYLNLTSVKFTYVIYKKQC